MNTDDAVRVLNEFRHRGFNDWIAIPEERGGPEVFPESAAMNSLCPLEAIAIAREYERLAGRDMPATRLMVRRLKMCAFDDVTMQAKVAETMSRYEINAAVAEWCDQPNPSTETDA